MGVVSHSSEKAGHLLPLPSSHSALPTAPISLVSKLYLLVEVALQNSKIWSPYLVSSFNLFPSALQFPFQDKS